MISEEERKKYVEFMYNPENEYNCDEFQKIKILMIGKENILAGNKIAGLLVIAEKLWNKYKV